MYDCMYLTYLFYGKFYDTFIHTLYYNLLKINVEECLCLVTSINRRLIVASIIVAKN